jgi:hypothetical protein
MLLTDRPCAQLASSLTAAALGGDAAEQKAELAALSA